MDLRGGGAKPVWSAVVCRGAGCIIWDARDVNPTDEDEDGAGEDVRDGEEVRCIGFLATGGAFLDVELIVELDRRRSSSVVVV